MNTDRTVHGKKSGWAITAHWAAGVLLLLSLGCGSRSAAPSSVQLENRLIQPSTAPSWSPTTLPSTSPQPSPTRVSPSPVPAIPVATPSPSTPLYQQAIQTYASLRGYSGQIQAYGHLRGAVVGATITVQWQSPRLLRMVVLDTNVLKGDQTTLLYEGGTTVRILAPRWAPIAAGIALDDPRLFLQDGQRFDSLTIGGLLARFQEPGTQVKDIGEITWNGHKARVYELHAPGDAARWLTKQIIGIDQQGRYPLYAEQYGTNGLLNQVVVTAFQANTTFPPGTFSL